MTTATSNGCKLVEPNEVRRALALLLPPGQVTELRALEATVNGDRWAATYSGYFNDAEKLVEAVSTIKSAQGIYITPNPVEPALHARAANRLKRADKNASTSDKQIVRRRCLLIDTDAQKPASGISATDAEHAAALERAAAIRDDLHFNHAWPDPIEADSGNGGHLIYAIDLPADDAGLIQRCLAALAAQFSDEVVKVDTTVFNPARIWKLYGTRACKGDSTADRPHRMSRILNKPDSLVPVSREQLESLASEVPEPEPKPEASSKPGTNGSTFDIDSFVQRNGLEVDGPHPYNGGRKWTFKRSPLCEHHSDGPHLIQFSSGALFAGCHHESCKGKWGWTDLRAKYEPRQERTQSTEHHEQPRREASARRYAFTFAELLREHPKLNPIVIDGLAREGETINTISYSKIGKSWLTYGLELSLISGWSWLGKFNTESGRVLHLDNELHKSTLVHRYSRVGEAMGLDPSDYENELDIWSLRGSVPSLNDLEARFDEIEPGEYKLVVFDAKYRFLSAGTSENDNAAETQLYNLLDRIAERTRAALVLIHHTSKGDQSGKRVTDVGSGAGAQSRAADTHLVLREHEQPGTVVLEAALRSFAPVEPLALRWAFPLWLPDGSVDPGKLKGKQNANEERQQEKDRDGINATVDALLKGPATARQIRRLTGFGEYRQERLLDQLTAAKQVIATERTFGKKTYVEYQLAE